MNELSRSLKIASKQALDAYEVARAAKAMVARICEEAIAREDRHSQRLSIAGLPSWESLKNAGADLQIAAAVHAALKSDRNGWFGGRWENWIRDQVRYQIASQLLRRRLPYQETHLASLVWKAAKHGYSGGRQPVASILGAVERLCGPKAPDGQLRLALQALKMRVAARAAPTPQQARIVKRIDTVLDPGARRPSIPQGAWTDTAKNWLESQNDECRAAWTDLLAFAATSAGKSRPSKKWLSESDGLISAIGRPSVASRIVQWLEETTIDEHLWGDPSLDVLKGLIWCCARLDYDTMARVIGRFAERCFGRLPYRGPRSEKLGNACIVTLASMAASDAAVSELVRLKTRIRYAFARERIEKRLAEIAEKKAVNVFDLEEAALPDFGLSPGGRDGVKIGDATAVIQVVDDGVGLSWFGPDGKPRKAVPESVRRDRKVELNDLRRRVREIRSARAAQIVRLEDSWLEDRCWPLDVWRRRFLEHPLRRPLAMALIWRIESAAGTVDLMPSGEGFTSPSGEATDLPEGGTVRLWHPLDAAPDNVGAWRRHLLTARVTQPIKQAHREVYLVTEAERKTGTYSDRFAAHILRQQQFRALCRERRWQNDIQGSWEVGTVPFRVVPRRNLTVTFDIEPDEDVGTDALEVYPYVKTGQVEFFGEDNRPVPLADVPRIVFSELMRDVDLFVSVASAANDPASPDDGPDGRLGRYRRQHAFGDLGTMGRARRDLIAEIAPGLAIADRLAVTDRFLDVRGSRGEYRIHLGTGNVQIRPDDRVLRVIGRLQAIGDYRIWLPFVADQLLALILHQAFLLAQDDKISDPTILSQLLR